DLLGLMIMCCNADEYFARLGLKRGTDYEEPSKNYYVAKPGATPKYSSFLEKEIVWKMLLARDRTFKAKDLSVEQLQRHVSARIRVVAATGKVSWTFGLDTDSPLNPQYWSGPWVLQEGADPAKAVTDMFEGTTPYRTGCRYASLFVLLKGTLDEAGSAEFNQ